MNLRLALHGYLRIKRSNQEVFRRPMGRPANQRGHLSAANVQLRFPHDLSEPVSIVMWEFFPHLEISPVSKGVNDRLSGIATPGVT